MRVLVLNAGSSSLKASVLDGGKREPLARTTVELGSDATRTESLERAVEQALAELAAGGASPTSLAGVGHRVVHGGTAFRRPTRVDEAVLSELERLVELAPLHNGVALACIRAAGRLLPELAHVCAFDTSFHATLADDAFVYPLPWAWHERWGIRRFGFHGLSVEWAVGRTAELLDRPADRLELVVAHLGSGCSVTAVSGGRSVATSMGLTPLEGLMMGTRAGSVDPGILLELLRSGRLTLAELAEALDHGAGLLGVSGVSGDVRQLEEAAQAGNRRAALALEIFVRRAAEGISSAATSLARLDALVFTGGIGENAGRLRARIVERLAVLGMAPIPVDENGTDRLLATGDGRPAIVRVGAREDVVLARAVGEVLSAG